MIISNAAAFVCESDDAESVASSKTAKLVKCEQKQVTDVAVVPGVLAAVKQPSEAHVSATVSQ